MPYRFSLPLVAVLAVVVLAACGGRPDASAPDASVPDATADAAAAPPVERLSAEAFVARDLGDALVLDVRRPDEFAAGHLAGAVNIDVLADGFAAAVDTLDRDRTVYLYCRSGNRSGRAAELMRGMGFESLYNVGGYADLAAAGAATAEPGR